MDELTLRFLVNELKPRLRGGKVVGLRRVSAGRYVLALEMTAGGLAFVTIVPGDGGAIFAGKRPREEGRGVAGDLDGAVLVALAAAEDERAAYIDFDTEDGPARLEVGLFGRAGWLALLTAEGNPLTLVGRRRAAGPSPRERKPAASYPFEEAAALMAAGEKALVTAVRFMSPLAARALLGAAEGRSERWRALAGLSDAASRGDVAPAPQALKTADSWHAFGGDIFVGVAVDDRRSFQSLNDAVAFAYETGAEDRARAAALAAEGRRLRAALARLERQQAAVAGQLAAFENGEEYRRKGEALKFNLNAVPRGARVVTLPDYHTGGELTIELAPDLSAAANADKYFSFYRKAKRGRINAAARLEALGAEISEKRERLAALERGDLEPPPASTADSKSARALKKSEGPGRRYTSSDGLLILVGRSAAENDELTFGLAKPYDLWLHAQQAHGSHVVIKRAGKGQEIPRRTVEEAAALAALHSGARHAHHVPVLVVERRYVRRIKGALGRVTVSREEVLFVEPAEKAKPAAGRG